MKRIRRTGQTLSALCLLLLVSCAGRTVPVVFSHVDPSAVKVCVAGDFNGWSAEALCLERDGGLLAGQVDLPPGRYRYQLLVDGRSMPDPGNPLVEESGFGGGDSVLVVE